MKVAPTYQGGLQNKTPLSFHSRGVLFFEVRNLLEEAPQLWGASNWSTNKLTYLLNKFFRSRIEFFHKLLELRACSRINIKAQLLGFSKKVWIFHGLVKG